jgi:RNA polymerase sigma-70 factor (ECF subfamily)
MDTRVSLIQRVRNRHDSVAWEEFFSIYSPLLTNYVRKRGISVNDAADIVQIIFARLVPALAKFELDAERGNFRSWLWQVARNALSDWARKRAARRRVERAWGDFEPGARPRDPDPEWNDPHYRGILKVVTQRIRATSQPVTWACFEGRILAARPAAEIAAETGLSVNAVYVNASRVLARVRERCQTFREPIETV